MQISSYISRNIYEVEILGTKSYNKGNFGISKYSNIQNLWIKGCEVADITATLNLYYNHSDLADIAGTSETF